MWALCCLGLVSVGVAQAQTSFTDVTVAAGLAYLQQDPPAAPPGCALGGGGFCQPQLMSGGAAVADVDGDGDPDLYVTRVDAPDILFLNQGNGSFSDGSVAAGFAAYDLQSNGAAFGDVDNDGDPDLLVSVIGADPDPVNNRNYLFLNDGNGVFQEDAVARGAAIPTQPSQERYGWGVAWGDYDRDGWIDALVAEWQNGEHAALLRNLGASQPGVFTDATLTAGLDFVGVNGFAPGFVDLDDDGYQDIALAADFMTSRLFWNDGDASFTDGTLAAGVGSDENGMGSTLGDVDGDGDLDWFVTAIFDPADPCGQTGCNWGSTGNRLYRNEGSRVFSDITDASGVRNGDFGWGAAFFDMDNDGDQDLAMTNGVDFPGVALDDAFHDDPMRLWRNDGAGNMTEVAAASGVSDTGSGKALLTFDYDGDGDLDMFVVNNAGMPVLYRNDLPSGNRWLRVSVRGNISNRDGLGAVVKVWTTEGSTPQVREVGAGSQLLGHGERVAHFGFGPGVSSVYRVQVHYPASGQFKVRQHMKTNRSITMPENPEPCGLLGIEPLALLALPGLRRWRRARSARPA